MPDRKFVPSFGELIDRLSICQQKEIYIPEKREIFTQQINDIVSDLDSMVKGKDIWLSGEMIRLIVILTQLNTWIWQNESNRRNGIEDGNDLSLTHSLNSLRTLVYSKISTLAGDRAEYKTNTLMPHSQWIPSGL